MAGIFGRAENYPFHLPEVLSLCLPLISPLFAKIPSHSAPFCLCSEMLLRLACSTQNYDWGKVGDSSTVSQLAALNGDITIDSTTSYAEYWFGTHHAGPSSIRAADGTVDETLGAWLSRSPDALGSMVERPDCVVADNHCGLPYLAKVLSISKCLSIQAHPDKALAEKLHAERPDVYKDPNHKPEMAVALTPFEAMCGFRQVSEIIDFIATVPEFRAILEGATGQGVDTVKHLQQAANSKDSTVVRAALKALFRVYANADPVLVALQVDALVNRVTATGGTTAEGNKEGEEKENQTKTKDPSGKHLAEGLAVRLASQYPGDIGVFAPFLLNFLNLQPGDAIFLAANEPHAYVSGDCFEVMANSNNVVRMGCTPKLRDVPVLTEMLTFNSGLPNVLRGNTLDDHVCVYKPTDPAVTEFQLERIEVATGHSYQLTPPSTPSILIVLQGQGVLSPSKGAEPPADLAPTGTVASRGHVYIQKAGAALEIIGKGETGTQMFRVQCRE